MTGTSPPKMPPAGATATVVTPLARATGIASLSAWYATRVRSCGLQVEHLVDVVEPADARLVEPDRRARVDEAGIDVRAGGVDHPGAGRHLHVGADRLDPAAADDDRAALEFPAT